MAETKHPIRNAVAGTIISAVLTGLAGYFFPNWGSFFAAVGNIVRAVLKWLGEPASMSHWALLLWALASVGGISLFIAFLAGIGKNFSHAAVPPTSAKYFGIQWRWTVGQTGEIHNIAAFCPHCDLQIYPQDVYDGRYLTSMRYVCERGDFTSVNFDGREHELHNRVAREVQREMRAKKPAAG